MTPDPKAPPAGAFDDEVAAIRRFYTERFLPTNAWVTIQPHAYLCLRQRQRRVRESLVECGLDSLEKMRSLDVLDVGCGAGANLAWLVELGADPARLTGVDLVSERVAEARRKFAGVRFLDGDILRTDVGGPFDVVMLFAVLTSVTNAAMKRQIVDRCFELLRPGGVFLFYDLVSRREDPGTKDYKRLTFAELGGYLGGRRPRYFKRDYLRKSVAERIVPRFGVTAAELVQATGLWNLDATFAYVRA